MNQSTAPLASAIKILTGIVLIATATLFVATAIDHDFLFPAIILCAITVGSYLRAPTGYELTDDTLTINYRLGTKSFENVESCSLVSEKVHMGIRVWGNGGLFGATGIFWNKTDKFFRVYITAFKPEELVRIKTSKATIYISPEDPVSFASH